MSARTNLLDLLSVALDPNVFAVSMRASIPDTIPPGVIAVRVFTESVVPGPTLGSMLTYTLTLWALTPVQDVATVDGILDDRLDDLLGALLEIPLVSFVDANRGVTQEPSPEYHGYKLTLTAYANTTGA